MKLPDRLFMQDFHEKRIGRSIMIEEVSIWRAFYGDDRVHRDFGLPDRQSILLEKKLRYPKFLVCVWLTFCGDDYVYRYWDLPDRLFIR